MSSSQTLRKSSAWKRTKGLVSWSKLYSTVSIGMVQDVYTVHQRLSDRGRLTKTLIRTWIELKYMNYCAKPSPVTNSLVSWTISIFQLVLGYDSCSLYGNWVTLPLLPSRSLFKITFSCQYRYFRTGKHNLVTTQLPEEKSSTLTAAFLLSITLPPASSYIPTFSTRQELIISWVPDSIIIAPLQGRPETGLPANP